VSIVGYTKDKLDSLFGGKADLTGGTVPDAQLPSRLSDVELRAAFVRPQYHNTPSPLAQLGQYSSGRVVCNTDGTKLWSFNSSGFYQVDSLTSTAWTAKTLPTNLSPVNGVACRVFTPTGGPNAGTPLLFLLAYNTTTTVFELYSAPLVTGSTQFTWSSKLLSLAANATLIGNAMRVTSSLGLLIGEYSGGSNITAGPSVYATTDGATFTAVLGPLSTTRHVHGIYEDPYAAGTVYVTVGDQGSPHFMYRSVAGGAFSASMGFTEDWIWCVSDQSTGGGPLLIDRATLTPRWATTKPRHDKIAVPGGVGGRIITDLATTSGSPTVTSATAAFVASDVGRCVLNPNVLPYGVFITSVTNATTAVLSANATSTATGQTATITGDRFYATAYQGAIDPATGWLYVCANDTSNAGNVGGIFVLTGPDRPWTLLYPLHNVALANHELIIAGGYLWIDRFGPMPLLTALS